MRKATRSSRTKRFSVYPLYNSGMLYIGLALNDIR